MGVLHRHLDRAVAEPCLDLKQRHAGGDELRCEAVAGVVSANAAKARTTARAVHRSREMPRGKRLAVVLAEDEVSAQVAGLFQRLGERWGHRHASFVAVLRWPDDATA